MNNLCVMEITCVAETALKKLKKAQIPVYGCKKRGARFIFGVKDEHAEKAFAIFAKPCYNIVVKRRSAKKRLLSLLALRAGMVAGAAVFALAAYISGFFVLKIEVTGSGSYLKSEVAEIIECEGAAAGKPFSGFNKPVATGKILALPQVVFCNISKRGSVLVVDVQVENSHTGSASRSPLVSDSDGKITKITVICGTAAVGEGSAVKAGDVLIYPAETVNGKTESCIAVGYAEMECEKTFEYIAPDDSEESVRTAYAAVLSQEERIISRSHTILKTEKGVKISVCAKYLHRISINLT